MTEQPPSKRAAAEVHAAEQVGRFISQLVDAYSAPGPGQSRAPFLLIPHHGDFRDRLQVLLEDAFLLGAEQAKAKAKARSH